METIIRRRFLIFILGVVVTTGGGRSNSIGQKDMSTNNVTLCEGTCTCIQDGTLLKITCKRPLTPAQHAIVEKRIRIDANIRTLILKIPKLGQLPYAVCGLGELQTLDVSRCDLTRLQPTCVRNLTNLQHIDARFNQLTTIENGTFANMTQLKQIHLKHNRISTIAVDAFGNITELTRLKDVVVSHNELTEIDVWIYRLPYPNHRVDLTWNRILHMTNKRNHAFHCDTHPSGGEINLAHNSIRHLHQIFDVLNITRVEFYCMMFPCVSCTDRYRTWLDHNPLYCNCHDYFFYTITMHDNSRNSGTVCDGPPNLHGKHVIQIPLNDFVCPLADCITGATCLEIPHDQIVSVVIHDVATTDLPRELPSPYHDRIARVPYSYSINATYSAIWELPARSYWHNTSQLDLGHNKLRSIDPAALVQLVTHARTLYLNDNQLTRLPEEIGNATFHATLKMRLDGNPWSCDCRSVWLRELIVKLAASSHIEDAASIICDSPTALRGISMIRVLDHMYAC